MGFIGLHGRTFMLPLAILATILFAMPRVHAADAEVTDIRAGEHGLSTRIVVDLDRPVAASVFALAGPARLVIDLPEVGWRLPQRPLPTDIGVLARLRYGLFQPGNSRIVVDLKQPSRVHQAIALPASGDQPDRLVIDLARTSGSTFLKAVQAAPMRIEGRESKIVRAEPTLPSSLKRSAPAVQVAAVTPRVAAPKAPSVAAPTVNRVSTPTPVARGGARSQLASVRLPRKPPVPNTGHKKIIVVDPGHGGIDPGAISVSGNYEKYITLATARALKRHLEATGKFKVYMTRDRDIFIPLRRRTEIARDKHADLFISLHADTVHNKRIRGLSIYTLSERASDKEAAALAERENKSDLIAGVDLSHESNEVTNILIDLAQRETMNQSSRFASLVVDNMDQDRVKVLRNPHRFAGFVVLKAPDVPSVLIELGFLSNRRDEHALRTKAHREHVAAAITQAVEGYFRQTESASRL